MRTLLFIILTLTLIACARKNSASGIVTNNLKYSAYYWHLNQNTDSFQFYLAHYIDIDKDGNFKLTRHDDFMDKPKYFEGTLSDTVQKVINSTFRNKTFKSDYTLNVDDGFIYDGFTYCFDITKADKKGDAKIIFIPNKSPSQIKFLATLLDTVISDRAKNMIDTMNFKNYEEELKQYHVTAFGQLPKIKKETPKFEPFKIAK